MSCDRRKSRTHLTI